MKVANELIERVIDGEYITSVVDKVLSDKKEYKINEVYSEGYKQSLWKTIDGINIYLVDGSKIRKEIEIDFTTGGHSKRYSWIPENEIWLDSLVFPSELPFNALHELVELNMMRKGADYDTAHDYANTIEREYRIKGWIDDKDLKRYASL